MRVVDGGISICPLGSGSKGNAYWVESDTTALLVDAGFSHKQLAGRISDIGRDIRDVEHIFITHEHADHVKGLRVLLNKQRATVWASGGTLRAIRKHLPDGASVRRFNGQIETCGNIAVQAFAVNHDAAEPLAYRFDAPAGSLAVLTDLGAWTPALAEALDGPDLLVCEANHDPDMLANGPYPWYLKQRVASDRGHLNNEQGAGLARAMLAAGTRDVILAHLSETNNRPDVALDVFRTTLNGRAERAHLQVAAQHHPGPWVRSVHEEPQHGIG